jgi:hypothetical protein
MTDAEHDVKKRLNEAHESYVREHGLPAALRPGLPIPPTTLGRGRSKHWIQTHSGGRYDFDGPYAHNPEDVNLSDIAAALAKQCRFNGMVQRFYGVAEHSVLVARLIQRWHPGKVELARFALMHDAHEAYVGDLVGPLKRLIPRFGEIEDLVDAAVMARFGLSPTEEDRKLVLEADLAMLGAEAFDCLKGTRERLGEWSLDIAQLSSQVFEHERPRCWSWVEAESWFLDKARILGVKEI